VVSHSLEESAKAVDAEKRYNKRVTEGKLAVKLVAKGLGVPAWRSIATFRHLQETLKLPSPGSMLSAVEQFLDAAPYSLTTAAAAAGEALEGLFEGDNKRAGALRVLDSLKATPDAPELALRARARHVCAEAERVFELQRACEGELEGEAQLTAMGALMDASHASCRDDYECSSPRLELVVAAAKRHGAYGARLTGAGWGGCAVSLVHKDRVAQFLAGLNEDYYGGKATPEVLFASPPGAGAAVYDLGGL
jgi:N-acetylgalactosamine kinase